VNEYREPLGPTYRLQLNGLGLRRAERLVDYLAGLGIRTLYLSPITTAATGSTHGYDVVDPTTLDSSLGTMDDFRSLLAEVDTHGMRVLLDIVPNHMAAIEENRWWYDVLRNGSRSRSSRLFDIDWEAGGGRLVLPVLANPLADTVRVGDLRIDASGNEPVLVYADRRFPLSPETTQLVGNDRQLADRINKSTNELHDLIDAQHYRLAHWRVAPYEVNYRRFFDIDGLVGVRVEDPEVYRITHTFILEVASDPRVGGVRVDHIDGLADPESYLERLRADLPQHCNILVEKVLSRGEELRPGWKADGTTGYEFADLVFALLTDPDGVEALASNVESRFGQMEVAACREILARSFPGALSRLAAGISDPGETHREGHDVAGRAIRIAVSELIAHMPVYRTYPVGRSRDDANRQVMAHALAGAHRDASDESVHRALDIVVEVLAADPSGSNRSEMRTRFEQLTSAVTAKGVEDTALYRYRGLLSTADVGSRPDEPPVTAPVFHQAMKHRLRRQPGALNATSTHDSKRGEDVRSRIAVLSEIPQRWAELERIWRDRHEVLALGSFGETPPPEVESALYQTIAGVWPTNSAWSPRLTVRVRDYALKAARESKLHTSWIHPDDGFESGLLRFVDGILDESNRFFLEEMQELVCDIAPAGMVNSLAAVVLRVAAPGVGDFYQGCEAWRPLLVDPDNRVPVDFEHLEQVTSSLPSGNHASVARELMARWYDGALKAYVVRAALTARQSKEWLFARGEYTGVTSRGLYADHVVSFSRTEGSGIALVVVPRLSLGVSGPGKMPTGDQWSDTRLVLPDYSALTFREVFSGRVLKTRNSGSTGDAYLPVAEVLSDLPVSLLIQP
jgi:(1->4)-alpha-D-glucan 1-alpha-D-glucosylmutase